MVSKTILVIETEDRTVDHQQLEEEENGMEFAVQRVQSSSLAR